MRRIITAFVYFADEPIKKLAALRALSEELLCILDIEPALVNSATYDAHCSRDYKFTWKRFDDLVSASEKTSGVFFEEVRSSKRWFHMELFLRHDPKFTQTTPGCLAFSVECDCAEAESYAVAAAWRLFRRAACMLDVLHGGITAFSRAEESSAEITFTSVGMAGKEPEKFEDRTQYDSLNSCDLWEKARRVYWVTLLGPTLARATGGVAAAVEAGAIKASEMNRCVVFQATQNLMQSQDSVFLEQTTALRKWFWPYTVQNPADAAGILEETE